MTIEYFSLGHPLTGIRSHFAEKARRRLFSLFISAMQPTSTSSVIYFWHKMKIPYPNPTFLKKFTHKNKIMAASIEDASFLEGVYPGLQFVRIQPGTLPFADNQFDILFCSAVIEHVGDSESQRNFIKESIRVARQFFFITPNRHFPIEFHTFLPFLHWLPQTMHQAALRRLGLDFWAKTENLNLLTPSSFLNLFPSCTSLHIYEYRLFGLPSKMLLCMVESERD